MSAVAPTAGPAAQLRFDIEARDGAARTARITTAHGVVHTPAFMPVGTAATVKAMTTDALVRTGTEIVLANAYHLMLRPGVERIAALGGLHRFMNWRGPLLTDSGGFQVMSLAPLRQLSEHGVTFRSHIDGATHELTPERSVAMQAELGVDLAMVLDECTPFPASQAQAEESMNLTLRWAARARAAWRSEPGRGLFGIVQGSVYPDLRSACAAALGALDFDGYAIGGLAVGEGPEAMRVMVAHTAALLPAGRPRYLMGVGRPGDIIAAVREGIDLFDCVLPTRSGRTGRAFTRRGTLNMRNARHAADPRPLDEGCTCPACAGHSRAYLHHLFQAKEMLGAVLLTWHNIHYYQDLLRGLREAIAAGRTVAYAGAMEAALAGGDDAP